MAAAVENVHPAVVVAHSKIDIKQSPICKLQMGLFMYNNVLLMDKYRVNNPLQFFQIERFGKIGFSTGMVGK
jgi:hypothetical protein